MNIGADDQPEVDEDYEILFGVDAVCTVLDEIADQIVREGRDGPAAADLVRLVRARLEQRAVLTVANRVLARAAADGA